MHTNEIFVVIVTCIVSSVDAISKKKKHIQMTTMQSGIFVVVVACIAYSVDARRAAARPGRPTDSSAGGPPGQSAGRSLAAPGRSLPKPKGPSASNTGAPPSVNPIVLNPCHPNSCYKFKIIRNYQTHEKWSIGRSKWLKVKTVPYNVSLDEYQFYRGLSDTGLKQSIPALVVINLGGTLSSYKEQMNTLSSLMKTEAAKLVTDLQQLSRQSSGRNASDAEIKQLQGRLLAIRAAYAAAHSRLTEQAKNLRKSWTVTVYNFLDEKYQPTDTNPNPPPPDLSGKPNLSVVTVPLFEVFTTSYMYHGFEPSLELTSQLAKEVNQPTVDTLYFLNYLNPRHDVWLPVDQNMNPFP